MMRRSAVLLALSLAVCAGLPSCAGYRLGNVKPAVMREVHTLAVPNAKNLTLEPRIDVHVTNAVIAKIQEDGTYKVTTGDKADASLELEIERFDRRQMRSARFNTLRTRELGLTMTLRYELVSLHSQTTLMSGTVRGETTVFMDGNHQGAEREALPEAAERAAERLTSIISEGW